jgi:hypothetical protein
MARVGGHQGGGRRKMYTDSIESMFLIVVVVFDGSSDVASGVIELKMCKS